MSVLLTNVHEGLSNPISKTYPEVTFDISFVRGKYEYYHYGCGGFSDEGWGCGYRTLQTIASWLINQKVSACLTMPSVPSIPDIQRALVEMGDKEEDFVGSHQWIGSVEVAMVIDHLYEVSSRLLHVPLGSDLQQHVPILKAHFEQNGSPLMMGGDRDASSKGILGVCSGPLDSHSLLVLDPHCRTKLQSREHVQTQGWVAWTPLDKFMDSSFYNICLPLYKGHT